MSAPAARAPRSAQSTGVVYGLISYVIWGLFPLYFPLLDRATSWEVLAHRIVWSLLVMSVIVALAGSPRKLAALYRSPRQFRWLAAAGVVVSVNWGVYIWAVGQDRVVETSIGYFINPLATILLGVVFLGERLRRGQWIAVGIAVLAVVAFSVDYGHLPWISLVLAASFSLYSLAKKKADAGAFESLTVETSVTAPFAVAFLIVLGSHGDGAFGHEGFWYSGLLMSAGVVTVVPLIFFGAAATRVPMLVLGLLQYFAPIGQLILGITYFHEDMTTGRWIAFAILWVALAVFTWEAIRHARTTRTAITADDLEVEEPV